MAILNFVVSFDLNIVKSFFKKKENHLVTFRSGSFKTQIDYFLIRVNHRSMCKDCKVIPSECLGTRHRLLAMDLMFKSFKVKNKSIGMAKVRWWNLTKENAIKLSGRIKSEASWKLVEDADAMWEGMGQCIRRST